jgi:hypothetical protein
MITDAHSELVFWNLEDLNSLDRLDRPVDLRRSL